MKPSGNRRSDTPGTAAWQRRSAGLFLFLSCLLALLAACQCVAGSKCNGLTQDQVDRAINQSNTTVGVRKALCDVLSYSQTSTYGAGCVIEWR